MEIVRRVMDEETVLEMVTTFLMMTREERVPPEARIEFHSSTFDPTSGGNKTSSLFIITEYFYSAGLFELSAYLNYYKLSRVIDISINLIRHLKSPCHQLH